MIYLDCNATTPCDPGVTEAMLPFFSACFGNPASPHTPGRDAAEAVEKVRQSILHHIGANQGTILFNSGATEGNNHVLHFARQRRILLSTTEHASVTNPARLLKKNGADVLEIEPTPEELEKQIKNGVFVSFRLANHETGILLQQTAEMAEIIHSKQGLFHLDATQAFGKIPVDVEKNGCDFMTFSAHKIYGPKGVGALYVRNPDRFEPLIFGGGQQNGLRAGTLNVPGIIGFGKAVENQSGHVWSPVLRNEFEQRIRRSGVPVRIAGEKLERLPQTSCLLFPGMDSGKLVAAMNRAGFAVSGGSACSAGEASETLKAMGFSALECAGAIRISHGYDTSAAEMNAAADALIQILGSMKTEGVVNVDDY